MLYLISVIIACMGGDTYASGAQRKQVNIPSALTDTDKHKCVQCSDRAMLRIMLTVNYKYKNCQFLSKCITKLSVQQYYCISLVLAKMVGDCYLVSCQCPDVTDASAPLHMTTTMK